MPVDVSRWAWTLRGLFGMLAVLMFALDASTPTLAADTTPPDLLLAERYRGDIDVARYWVSEKLDGARAVWDGKSLRFRSGNRVPAPQWFLDALPDQPLDGELWLGRGTFDQLSAIVRRQAPEDAAWRRVRNMIFESPNAPGSFTDRVEQIKAVAAAANLPWLQAIPQFRLPDGRRFSLGSGLTDALRRNPPPVGTQITYRYRELTKNGMSRFPKVSAGARQALTWS